MSIRKSRVGWVTLGFLASVSVGCGAGVAPQELHTARDAMKHAETQSQAPQLAPVKLEEAKQALDQAEDAFKGGADAQEVKDLSYVAERKAQLAISTANMELAKRLAAQAQQDKDNLQKQAFTNTKQRLSQTQEQLAAEQRKAEEEARRAAEEKRRLDEAAKKGKKEVERVKKELEAERKAREEAEKKAAAAMASLQEIAKVKEEKRGVVITLSGSVLFATGQYHLLPIAKEKLNEVAKALKDQGYKNIVVEGHTDSRGSAAKNETLSLQRAQEVRNYLISQGIESGKIQARGYGPRRPVADNGTPEGRANNRRVELVVTPE